MTDDARGLTEGALVWTHTGDAEIPYTTEVDGRRFTVRINDFPAEPLYTLLSEGAELYDLEDWPELWVMPEPPKALLDLLSPRKAAMPQQLHRLLRLLEGRALPSRALLRAVDLAREVRHHVEVSALSRRLTLLLPFRAEVLEALAPSTALPPPPPRPLLKAFLDGDRCDVALAIVGAVSPQEAVDVAPEPARDTWRDVVAALHDLGSARISGRMRFLTQPRAKIDVHSLARSPDADLRFAESVDEIAARLRVPEGQRELFRAVHPAMGGVPATVTTTCAENGPAPELAIGYARSDWDEAVGLCTRVASQEAARGGAAVLGLVASTLGDLQALTLVLRPEGVDVVALATLR